VCPQHLEKEESKMTEDLPRDDEDDSIEGSSDHLQEVPDEDLKHLLNRIRRLEEEDEAETGAASPSSIVKQLAERKEAFARYEMKGELARGGMGVVLRVWDKDLDRNLAMKVVLGKGGASAGDTPEVDPRTLSRFLEEARIAGQLDHPGIVPIHELGLDSQGRVYFTMKLVKGHDFKEVLGFLHRREHGWTVTRALGVLLKVCEAMAYAHSKGVIHRDLKPSNIMVGRFGEVYVMDWGLARVLGQEDRKDIRIRPELVSESGELHSDRRDHAGGKPDSLLVTMDGDVVGTPAYMSPEQANGRIEGVGTQSDVYSIGATLYELLTGQVPYVPAGAKLNNYAVWQLVQLGPPPPLRDLARGVPEELEAICEKAMAQKPENRYADVEALALDLRAYLESRVVRAHRTGAVAEFTKWVARNKGMAAAIAATLVALVAGLITSLMLKEQSDENATQAAEGRNRALINESRYLADRANEQTESGDATTGLLLALEALPRDVNNPDRPYVAEAEVALHHALLSHREVAVLRGHRGAVGHAAFSPDGTRIITSSSDGTSRLWDTEGREIAVFRSHEEDPTTLGGLGDHRYHVWCAAFSPDGTHIVTASADGTARLWDTKGSQMAVAHHEDVVRCAEFSPDGKTFVTGSKDGTARLWSTDGVELATLPHEGEVLHAAFSPDGGRIVTASADRTAGLWDISGHRLAVLSHGGSVLHAEFSSDGRRILTASMDQTARLWNTDGAEIARLAHERYVVHAAFSSDSRRIVTASGDGTARLWDTKGRTIRVLHHEGNVPHASFSSDGNSIVTVSISMDSDLRQLDPRSPFSTAWLWQTNGPGKAMLRGYEGTIRYAAFSPDGSRIVTTSFDGTARIWNAESPGPQSIHPQDGPVRLIAFSPDGRTMVTASHTQMAASLWNIDGQRVAVLGGHEGLVLHAVFSPDGGCIATASLDNIGRLWDTGGSLISTLRGHTDGILHVAFSSDGSRVATASRDKTARIWDVAGGEIGILTGHLGAVSRVTFSPDSRRVLTTSNDTTARLWDATGSQIAVLPHHGPVRSAEFSPDSDRLVTASSDGTARLWDVGGREIATLRHEGPVVDSGFSPDGSRIITRVVENASVRARLWDYNGREVALLKTQGRYVGLAAFLHDGRRIITVVEDGTAELWDKDGHRVARLLGPSGMPGTIALSPEGDHIALSTPLGVELCPIFVMESQALIDHARAIAPRITPDQRRRFFPEADPSELTPDYRGRDVIEEKAESVDVTAARSSPPPDKRSPTDTGQDGRGAGEDQQTPEECLCRGLVAFEAEEYATAEKAYRAAMEHPNVQEPTRGLAHFYLSASLGNQGQHAKAVEATKAWLERYPDGEQRHLLLLFQGIYLRELGREDEARACWEAILEETPESDFAEHARVELGRLPEAGPADEGMGESIGVLLSGEVAPTPKAQTPEEHVRRGHAAFFDARDYASAESAYRAAMEHPDVTEPTRGLAHFYLSASLGNQGKHAEAVEAKSAWLERYRDDEHRHYVLLFQGIYLRELGREDEARACWEAIVDEAPDSDLAAHARSQLGRPPEPGQVDGRTGESVGVLAPGAAAPGGYLVVRVALDKADPGHEGFQRAAERVAGFHRAQSVDWDGSDPDALIAAFAERPRNVLFVVPPDVLDVNLHRRVLLASAGLDDDVFPDFAFGYLTARDGAGVESLWKRNERLHETGLGSTVWLSTSVTSGMKSTLYPDSVPALAKEAGFRGDHYYFAELSSDADVLERVAQWLPALSKASVVQMTGNGDPQGIWLFDGGRNLDETKHWPYDADRVGSDAEGEMPRIMASDFRGLRLESPVVWSGTCHSAATGRVFVEGDIVSTFGATTRATAHRLEADESLCLSLLQSGAAALLAPIAANHGMSVSRESDFALVHGATLGEAVKSTYDDVHLQARGRPALAFQVDGESERHDGNIMQGGGSNRVLIGDPALAPFSATSDASEVVEIARRGEDGFDVEVRWNEGWHSWAWDMFGTDRGRDWRVYARVPLDDLVPLDRRIGFVATVEATSADGRPLPFSVSRVEPESFHGRRFLHLQANASREFVERKEVRALFQVRIQAR